MSDDQIERAERTDDRAEEDVEAHMQDAPRDGSPHAGAREEPADVEAHVQDAPRDGAPHAGASEEPPDVEGHQLGGQMDPKPIE